jgi:hypothetical protein
MGRVLVTRASCCISSSISLNNLASTLGSAMRFTLQTLLRKSARLGCPEGSLCEFTSEMNSHLLSSHKVLSITTDLVEEGGGLALDTKCNISTLFTGGFP